MEQMYGHSLNVNTINKSYNCLLLRRIQLCPSFIQCMLIFCYVLQISVFLLVKKFREGHIESGANFLN